MEFGRLLGLIDQGDSWWFKETGPEIIPRLWTHNMTAIEVWRLWVVSHSWFACGFEISWDFVPCWHFWPRLPWQCFSNPRLSSISQRSGIQSAPFFGTSHCVACHCLVHRSTGHGSQQDTVKIGETGHLIVTVDTPGTSGTSDFVVLQCFTRCRSFWARVPKANVPNQLRNLASATQKGSRKVQWVTLKLRRLHKCSQVSTEVAARPPDFLRWWALRR